MLLPFIFECDTKRINQDTTYNFFLKRLSVVLQNNIANCILMRIYTLNAHYTISQDPTFVSDIVYIHPKAKQYLKKLTIAIGDTKRINQDTIYNFFLRRLSIVLQNSIANSILMRIHNLNAHYIVSQDPTFASDIILESDNIRF